MPPTSISSWCSSPILAGRSTRSAAPAWRCSTPSTPAAYPARSAMSDSDGPHVAVTGCGYWGKNLVRVFDQLGALVAVHDPDPVAAAAMTDAHGVQAREWPELLADPAVDAVAIAAPAARHGDLAAEALAGGKHVFVEKPLALSVGEAESLCATAEGAGRVLMVGHLLRYHPAFLALSEL